MIPNPPLPKLSEMHLRQTRERQHTAEFVARWRAAGDDGWLAVYNGLSLLHTMQLSGFVNAGANGLVVL